MALQLDTDEGAVTKRGNDGSEIAKWLKSENLQKLIPLFEEEDMSLDELIEFADDEDNFKQYLKELNVPKASIFRILSKIKKTRKSKPNNNNNDNNTPRSVVVISQKEQDAMDSLNKRNVNITALIQELTERNEKISQNEQAVKSKIKEEYNKLILLINQSQEGALKKLNEIAQKKKLKISAKSQQLESQQNNTKNAIKSCNELVHNIDIDRNERQNKILSTVDGVIKEQMAENGNDGSTDIILVFNKGSISSFISGLVDVYGEDKHPIPIIDNIQCKEVTKNECKVGWKAELNEQDLRKKVTSKLFMKVTNINMEMDEKEREEMNSEFILFDRDNTNYQHQMDKLKQDTTYKMNIVLYERKDRDNKVEERRDVQPTVFNFKTSADDFNEKEFVYQSDYDKNGICYFLGTNYGKEQWTNPAERGLIKLNSSGWWSGASINAMVGRKSVVSYSGNIDNGWVTFDFGAKLKIKPTHYTLIHQSDRDDYAPRNWNLEGSNNGSNWTTIKEHKNDETITKKGQSHTWSINNSNQYYQHFRIYMTGKDSSGYWHWMGTSLELYGHLTGNK